MTSVTFQANSLRDLAALTALRYKEEDCHQLPQTFWQTFFDNHYSAQLVAKKDDYLRLSLLFARALDFGEPFVSSRSSFSNRSFSVLEASGLRIIPLSIASSPEGSIDQASSSTKTRDPLSQEGFREALEYPDQILGGNAVLQNGEVQDGTKYALFRKICILGAEMRLQAFIAKEGGFQHLLPECHMDDHLITGNEKIARTLLANGLPVTGIFGSNDRTLLQLAVERKWSAEFVQQLIADGVSLTHRSLVPHYTALDYACENGDLATAQLLIQKGYSLQYLQAEQTDDVSSLTLAAKSGNVELVQYLLEQGVNPNIRAGILGKTVLFEAGEYSAAVIRELLKAPGIDVERGCHLYGEHASPLSVLAGIEWKYGGGIREDRLDDPETLAKVDLLLQAGANPDNIATGFPRGHAKIAKIKARLKARQELLQSLDLDPALWEQSSTLDEID